MQGCKAHDKNQYRKLKGDYKKEKEQLKRIEKEREENVNERITQAYKEAERFIEEGNKKEKIVASIIKRAFEDTSLKAYWLIQ